MIVVAWMLLDWKCRIALRGSNLEFVEGAQKSVRLALA